MIDSGKNATLGVDLNVRFCMILKGAVLAVSNYIVVSIITITTTWVNIIVILLF